MRNTNPAFKKFLLHEKPFEINFFRFQRVFVKKKIFLTPDSCSSWFFTSRNVVFIKISKFFEKMQKICGRGGIRTCDLWSLPKSSCRLTHSAMRYQTFFEIRLKRTIAKNIIKYFLLRNKFEKIKYKKKFMWIFYLLNEKDRKENY